MGKVVRSIATAGALASLLVAAPSAYAAQATTTVEVNFPTVLVMYHYDTIQLEVTSPALANFLTGGSAVACAGDSCQSLGTLDLTVSDPISDLSAATVDALLSDTNPALNGGSTSATFTVQNAVGVRALGCANYSAAAAAGAGNDAAVTISATSLADIDGAACGLAMTVGDLVFDVDISAVSGTTVNAVFDVTVTGV